MSIDQTLFREALRHFASGVTVVTTTVDDRPVGLTVSAFTSLSLEPTLVLICIDRQAQSHAAIAQAGMFAVNILKEDQAHLSHLFASRTEGSKFASIDYHRSEQGLPLLDDALTTLECRVIDTCDGGDHTIYIGEVMAARVSSGAPLIHYQSAYRRLE
jgi:flavin reductase (DIM6/NTAB) family NADH-FMN oxidoreductase RutF